MLSWHTPVNKWLAFAKLHCRGAFSSLLLPADVPLSITAKKPKLEAGAGALELNVEMEKKRERTEVLLLKFCCFH